MSFLSAGWQTGICSGRMRRFLNALKAHLRLLADSSGMTLND